MNKIVQLMPAFVKIGLISSWAFVVLLLVTIPAWAGYTPPPNQDPPNDSSGSSTSFRLPLKQAV